MLKLRVKDMITLDFSGSSISVNFMYLTINSITLQLSISGYLDYEEYIYLDCYFDCRLNVPVLKIDNYKFPLYKTVKYKNLEISYRPDKSQSC